ncbi:putative glycolipid-binding domain-containing protein [Mitsuaria sp. GD03876]|uniref:putative glycolipid-binding domain-containing protein n=1 Tax=Mitsuaria sp. GD03876 TaxID=2975399 RepID=UPI00244AC01F|nr:putative glycolipid-binding domain-containing protein [Mitsuaria sp. GD03876]MDH0863303.1 putative glycolipid-binding domain-containing protein [Mitsuaria sp. GD03876]
MSHSFRTICWIPTWNPDHGNVGIEHLLLSDGQADGVVIAVDPDAGPFRLCYRLKWDAQWRLRGAGLSLAVDDGGPPRSLHLKTDGEGHWQDERGQPLRELDGCLDIDIWPTPFTNSLPIRRAPLKVGERREFRMAWIDGTTLAVRAQAQAYTRLDDRLYRFESLDGSGFQAELPVDDERLVIDYPGLFKRL